MLSNLESTMTIRWDIRRGGRRWEGEEASGRWQLTPEKFEMYRGKLFWSEADRINLLGLLLENVGADAAVRLGSLAVWEAALAAARESPREEFSREPNYEIEEEDEV